MAILQGRWNEQQRLQDQNAELRTRTAKLIAEIDGLRERVDELKKAVADLQLKLDRKGKVQVVDRQTGQTVAYMEWDKLLVELRYMHQKGGPIDQYMLTMNDRHYIDVRDLVGTFI